MTADDLRRYAEWHIARMVTARRDDWPARLPTGSGSMALVLYPTSMGLYPLFAVAYRTDRMGD